MPMASSEIADVPPPEPAASGRPDTARAQADQSIERESVANGATRGAGIGDSPHAPRHRRVDAIEIGAVIGIVAVAVAVRLGPLQRGLGFDELFTAIHFLQTDTLWQTATTWLNLNNHVAFSLLARVSLGLFG